MSPQQYDFTTQVPYMLHLQSNEVGGSYHMEKEGLEHVFKYLHAQRLTIGRVKHSEIMHYYDVWHVAKGMQCFFRFYKYA